MFVGRFFFKYMLYLDTVLPEKSAKFVAICAKYISVCNIALICHIHTYLRHN